MSRIFQLSDPLMTRPIVFCLAILTSVALFPIGNTGGQETSDRLQQYLDNKGFSRLSMLQLEKRLLAQPDSTIRNKLSVELAQRYRNYFFSNTAEASAAEFIERANWLSNNYPAINTANFKLAIIHARYLQAERQFRKWQQTSASPEGRDAVVDQFRVLEREIAKQIRHDEDQQKKLISTIALDSENQLEMQQLVDRAEVRLLHAHYLFAWSNYFLAVTSTEISKPMLQQAQLSFYRSLRIEQNEPIEQLDSKWLYFSAPISSRALLGLAAVYVALDRQSSARFCFDQAAAISGSELDREFHEFNALAFARKWPAAIEFALQQLQPSTTTAGSEFWEAVANAGYSSVEELPQLSKLKQLGMKGLAREFDFQRLRQFAVTEEFPFPPGAYENTWIETMVQFHIGDLNEAGLDDIATSIKSLVESKDEKNIDAEDLARIHCLAALIDFERGKFDSAMENIKRIDPKCLDADRAFGERLARLEVMVQLRRHSINPKFNAAALSATNRFITQFPQSASYQRVQFERFKLTNNLLPAKAALKKLKLVTPDAPFYSDVQFEIVNCLRRCMAESDGENSERINLYEELVVADKTFRSLPSLEAERKLASLLVVIDAALRIEKDPQSLRSLFDRAATIGKTVSPDSDQYSVLQFFQFRNDRQQNELQSAIELAQTISISSPQKPHRIAVLAFLAKMYDSTEQQKTVPLDIEMDQIKIYQMLSSELGSSTEQLRQSKNARVAATRLVELQVESGQDLKEAQILNNKLLLVLPNQLDLLLNRARISMSTGELKSALETWRKIGRFVSAGSDLWFESKLGTVKCLTSSNPGQAGKVMRQTINLTTEIPAKWKLEIEELNLSLQQTEQTR